MRTPSDYTKRKAILRGILEGRGYYVALQAMNYAEKLHNGHRKDGSHEFAHQVNMALHAACFLPSISEPEETMTLLFLHDVLEDKDVPFSAIEALFGPKMAHRTLCMSKIRGEQKLPNEVYYADLAGDPVVSVAKGFDRCHNLSTMRGAFDNRKQLAYLTEARDFTLPMIKKAQRNFPHQTPVYEGIKHTIRLLCDLTEHFIKQIETLDSGETLAR